MSIRAEFLLLAFLLVALPAQTQTAPDAGARVSLNVPSGVPLRLYLTGRVSKKMGAAVVAKLLEPVFSFDREVIPAGTTAVGQVSRTQSVGKWERLKAILNGDFTPLRQGEVEFTTLNLPDGRQIPIHTVETSGLNSIYIEPKAKKNSAKKKNNQSAPPQNPNGGILGMAKVAAMDRINGAINTRSRGFADIVRGPNKKERLIDLLWSKAPYHPQYWRRGSRFDAALGDPIDFGRASVNPDELGAVGTQPAPDSVAHVRLLTALSSASAKQGETVEAVVTAPLFSSEHKLVLPEGTRLSGEVVLAKKARHFHRPGQLRFNFQKVDLPEESATLQSAPGLGPTSLKTPAALEAAEGSGTAPISVDSEGGVQAKESKARFIAPVVSLLLASRAADNDAGHTGATGADGNVAGRTLGGGLGLGMAGAALSQSSRYVGMAFGYYGLAWSVYSSVVARGGEVQFDKNAMMDIKFGTRRLESQFPSSSAGPVSAGH
jgi:hypothetical protein